MYGNLPGLYTPSYRAFESSQFTLPAFLLGYLAIALLALAGAAFLAGDYLALGEALAGGLPLLAGKTFTSSSSEELLLLSSLSSLTLETRRRGIPLYPTTGATGTGLTSSFFSYSTLYYT